MVDITLPVIDMRPLFKGDEAARLKTAKEIEDACRDLGFFYVTGHGLGADTVAALDAASRAFFALPKETKRHIDMSKGGKAWRGFFAVGDELTSGRPDLKEGIYFGSELPEDHPRVKEGWPLHGANLWPQEVPELKEAVLTYMAETTRAAHKLMEGIALSLGLAPGYFERVYTSDPTVLFRIFHYPPRAPQDDDKDWSKSWSVGEHTDYGLLTLLAQDDKGGLQVKSRQGWIEAPPIEGTLVCNIGDMLDRLTGGFYRSTPHRVSNTSGLGRLSFPLFFDPDFSAVMEPLPHAPRAQGEAIADRWDKADLQAFSGTYGDYLISKVSKVFPELQRTVL